MDNTVLRANSINKYFYQPEPFHVIKDISMEINKGEFVSLIGKSGSGKTTFLYVLSTLDTDYQGSLEINHKTLTGKQIDELAQFRNEHIGFVFQFHYLLPEFSSIKNVMIPAQKLKRYSVGEIEERAYQKLKMLDVHEQALKPAGKLSGGQQQRVAIARALINDPTVIMADEPTGNLDSRNTGEVIEVFKHISKDLNQTIIAVTHDKDFAKNTDRIIEMSDGVILKK